MRFGVTSEMGKGGCKTTVSQRIGGVLTLGFPPRRDGFLKTTKFNKSRPHPKKRVV